VLLVCNGNRMIVAPDHPDYKEIVECVTLNRPQSLAHLLGVTLSSQPRFRGRRVCGPDGSRTYMGLPTVSTKPVKP
jgi:hypothetical protein